MTLEASVVSTSPQSIKNLAGYSVTVKGQAKRAGREKKAAAEGAETVIEGVWRVWVPPHIVEGHFGDK